MNKERISKLISQYEHELFDSVMPFWEKYSIDKEYGGYIHYLDEKGGVISDDKAIWLQARECWLFARLYNTHEKKQRWLEYSKIGYDFLMKHGFDDRGKMYFSVTRDGRPLRNRRYYFSETFMIIACAEYARASGDAAAMDFARMLFDKVMGYYTNPDPKLLPPKINPNTRPSIGHAQPMILIATAQTLRECNDNTTQYDETIDWLINIILDKFVKPEHKALLESVSPDGSIIDTPEGRTINPGHAIETSWFLMHEGLYRDDEKLINQALDILSWSFEWGWDKEYGGLLSFVDLKHLPPEKMEWDMKYWWPHNELLYASLLAHYITGAKRYEKMYEMTHDYAFEKFPDGEHGEWFGYLHRDGSIALNIKGSMFKGAFHLPRQLLYTLELLKKMKEC